MNNPIGIFIGHTEASVDAMTKGILKILSAPYADQQTKQLALEVLSKGLSISNTTIQECSVNMGAPNKNK